MPVSDISRHFDTVSVCLSKGLGAPVGSVSCGPREIVAKARRWRKVLGGGMRQAGMLAAAGIFALEHNVARLAEDHTNAQVLAAGLSAIDGMTITGAAQTNMVFAKFPAARADALRDFLKQRQMLVGVGPNLRMVTHLDVSAQDVTRFVTAVDDFFRQAA